jgi:hypothetical protein
MARPAIWTSGSILEGVLFLSLCGTDIKEETKGSDTDHEATLEELAGLEKNRRSDKVINDEEKAEGMVCGRYSTVRVCDQLAPNWR